MGNPGDALIIENLFDTGKLIAQRPWQLLCEDVYISLIYGSDEHSPRAAFLRYLPGASVPSHIHRGLEHILILAGSQLDGDKVYGKGDLVIHDAGSDHQITSPEGCVVLGIWQRPVMFRQMDAAK